MGLELPGFLEDDADLLRLRQNQLIEPVGWDPDKSSNGKADGVAKDPKRDRHSIFSGGK